MMLISLKTYYLQSCDYQAAHKGMCVYVDLIGNSTPFIYL